MQAAITAIAYHLPLKRVTNRDLQAVAAGWDAAKVEAKTGIVERRIVNEEQCSSDLAVAAANQLFEEGGCEPADVDYLILCTQTPDYFLPTTACLLQARLGLPKTCGALDVNLGCSGYVYGLGLAKGLIETGQARQVLLLTAETYSKLMADDDLSTRTIFGDGAAATLVTAVDEAPAAGGEWIGPFVYGTDGTGGDNLIVRGGAFRNATHLDGEQNGQNCDRVLHMNGPEIFSFASAVVPSAVDQLLAKAQIARDDVDRYVFHQANAYMLEHLRRRMQIAPERCVLALRSCGNTVSSTIPIALRDSVADGRMATHQRAMLVGFGVGYSWGAALVRLYGSPFFATLEQQPCPA